MTAAEPNPDRADLAEFLRARSGSAFERLARRYADMVYGTCLRLVRRSADAEDAAQAVFLALARKAGSVDPERLGGWLHTAAVRAALMANRAEVARARHEEEAARMREATVQSAGDAAADWAAVRPHLDAEVERLPAELREAVVRHFFAGRSHAELAAELGVPRSTAASRVQLGLERLRERLTRRGVMLGAAVLGPVILANAKVAAPATLLTSLPSLATGTVAAGATAGAGQGVSALAEGVLKMMFWAKVKLAAAVVAAVTVVGAGGGAVAVKLAAGEPGKDERVERKGPLAGLPSAPGPTVEKVKALGDNEWVDLGAPAPDPKWGRALGRSWSPKMPYAPDLRGAFITGEANHGWVNPKTHRQMDDYWFYDVNAHRWICVYPGTDVNDLDSLTINRDGFTATKDGNPVPVSLTGHAYEGVTYNTDLKRFETVGVGTLYGPAAEWSKQHKAKVEGGPWYFDTVAGKWGRLASKGPFPHMATYTDLFIYVPSKKQSFYHAFGWSRNHSYFYDPAANEWTEVKTNMTEGNKQSPNFPHGGNVVACYDSKRDRIYIGFTGKGLWYFDVKTNKWMDSAPPEAFKDVKMDTWNTVLNYDVVNDKIVAIAGMGPDKVYVYDPESNTSQATPGAIPIKQWEGNGFYDPVLNAHFVHNASGNNEGTMWVYRYKKAAK